MPDPSNLSAPPHVQKAMSVARQFRSNPQRTDDEQRKYCRALFIIAQWSCQIEQLPFTRYNMRRILGVDADLVLNSVPKDMMYGLK